MAALPEKMGRVCLCQQLHAEEWLTSFTTPILAVNNLEWDID